MVINFILFSITFIRSNEKGGNQAKKRKIQAQ